MDESQLQKKPDAPVDLRASDADRDRVSEILRDALAEGRLSTEEHSERLDGVYAAKTVGALEPFVRDLPAQGGGTTPAPAHRPFSPGPPTARDTENLLAVFGAAIRRGCWRVGRRTRALACFGGVEIDLTEAVFEQRETLINCFAVFGGIEVKVPENVTLRGSGVGLFGGFDVRGVEADDPNAPVVIVTGIALFGGVDAHPKRGKRLKRLGG